MNQPHDKLNEFPRTEVDRCVWFIYCIISPSECATRMATSIDSPPIDNSTETCWNCYCSDVYNHFQCRDHSIWQDRYGADSACLHNKVCVNQDIYIRNVATVGINKTFIVLNKYNKAEFIACELGYFMDPNRNWISITVNSFLNGAIY